MLYKSITAVILLLFSVTTYAFPLGDYVYVFSKDGGVFALHINDEPKIVYSGDAITIQTEKQSIILRIDDLSKVSFSEDATSHEDHIEIESPYELDYAEIYNLSGQFLQRAKKLEMQSLPMGIYIIKQGGESIMSKKTSR